MMSGVNKAFRHRYWIIVVPPGSWSRRPINQRTRRARWQAAIQVRGRLEHKMLSAPKLPEATALRAHAIMLRAVAQASEKLLDRPFVTRLRPLRSDSSHFHARGRETSTLVEFSQECAIQVEPCESRPRTMIPTLRTVTGPFLARFWRGDLTHLPSARLGRAGGLTSLDQIELLP